MSNSVADLARLKQAASSASEKRIRAEAGVDQAEKALRTLGYDTVEQAEVALKTMSRDLADKEEALDKDVDALYRKYPEL